ncbi:sugar ABC transporter substrate-binding protein [Planomonospora venezuelensis]|uniref:Ribose transport system substrate-binding protein n=1 Tax=Planomonospora venezuelensis TaxID=1999 RepID=A0A841DG86_PLAVE|nr:substrate-binding domain-containing protein [Planomonospora venezuelensis]MBB5967394.1 ribose transport system substrate-binding protein [Planomonospora venezuelensis]GIN05312.1 hypothetical protein Pve01_69700 [Planomonospora venezuelensis]
MVLSFSACPSRAVRARTALAATGLLAVACGGPSSARAGAGGGEADGKAPEDIRIAYVGAARNLNYSTEMMRGAAYAGREAGVDVEVVAPPGPDGPGQVALFRRVAADAVDGIAVMTLNPDLFPAPIAEVAGRGVPVIAVNTPVAGVKTVVSNDNEAAGRLAASTVLANIPPGTEGEVVIGITSPGVPGLELRARGMAEEIREKNPDLKVPDRPVETKQAAEDNYRAWSGYVRAHPDAVAFMDTGDPATFNLPKIKKETGGTWHNIAFDLNDDGLAALKRGDSDGVVDPQHWLKGYIAVRLLIEKAQGKRVAIPEGLWDSGVNVLTKANVDDIIARQKSDDSRAAWYGKLITEQFADIDARMKSLG